jgi:hypothetical protein
MRGEDHFRSIALAQTESLFQSARLVCGDPQVAEDLGPGTLERVYPSWGKRSIDGRPAYDRATVRILMSTRRGSTETPVPEVAVSRLPSDGSETFALRVVVDAQPILGGGARC